MTIGKQCGAADFFEGGMSSEVSENVKGATLASDVFEYFNQSLTDLSW